MITAIHIENFKGIRDRVKIDLKPITLLFGPNSSGKSTIIQALHYAREIMLNGNLDADETELGGPGVNLGGFRNFLHRQHFDEPELDRVLALRFDLDVAGSKFGLPEFPEDPVHQSFVEQSDDEAWMKSLDEIQSAWVEIRVRWSYLLEAPFLAQYGVGIEGRCFAVVSASDDGSKPHISYLDTEHPLVTAWREMELDEAVETLQSLSQDEKQALVEEVIEAAESIPESAANDDPFLARVENIDLPHQRTVIPRFDDLLGIGDDWPLDASLTRAIAGPGAMLRRALAQFRYLGSVREVPPRGFRPYTSHQEGRWATGLAAWDRLATDEGLLESAQQWLSSKDRMNTGYGLWLKRFREVDAESPLSFDLEDWSDTYNDDPDPGVAFRSLPIRTRLVVIKGEWGLGLELQPHDVGIGLAKMIPVVAAALDHSDGIVAIEEPEANVHPRWQVALGDLFIAQGVHDGHRFLLETHGEHLLLRLLRRIRETTDGEAPSEFTLTPDAVSVVYIENDAGYTVLHPLRIDDQGEFIDRWPHGFFAERAGELF